MIDARKRALVKAILWRILASMVLGTLTWILTGSLQAIGFMLLFFNLIQICTYFLYERLWNYISWGRTRGIFIQMTGMSGAGKTTLSCAVAKKLKAQGYKVELIDGDEYRKNVSKDLGFSKKDRTENIQRLGFIGHVLERNGVIAIMATINPYDSARQDLARLGAKTIYIKCNLDELKKRDTKGLYYRAMLEDGHPNKVYNLTGVSDPFEVPSNPDLVIDTYEEPLKASVDKLYHFTLKNSQ